ncbi:temptin-like [Physella acuta]|uniref:temptin-like n=1 Tax=Physella acuta TaxID=109671 RepID=UPI0027DBAEE0|nr:temptin-like [Physella acuta]
MLGSVVFLACLSLATAFIRYQDAIPNGDLVPHPCLIGYWPGVGHYLAEGSGARNEFGTDFAAAGHVWTPALCHLDSDRDGRTNGEELGDPQCRWTPEHPGNTVAPQTHPGICEPIGSPRCAWQAFACAGPL